MQEFSMLHIVPDIKAHFAVLYILQLQSSV